jgi:tetratricopeptide (TPR) repeat protein
MLGDAGGMLRHAREAVRAAEKVEAPAFIAMAYKSLGEASLHSRAYGDALTAYERALAVQEGFERKPFILAGLAWTHLALGDGETALKTAREAANVSRRLQGNLAEFWAQLCVAHVLLSTRGLGAREEIESALQTAAETAAEMGARASSPTCSSSVRAWPASWVTRAATVAISPNPIGSSLKWAQRGAQRGWSEN